MSKPNPFLKKATGSAKGPASAVPKKRHGLGRGLDNLLTSSKPAVPVDAPAANAPRPAAAAAAPGAPLELNILDIERSPYQPRREFREEELRELA